MRRSRRTQLLGSPSRQRTQKFNLRHVRMLNGVGRPRELQRLVAALNRIVPDSAFHNYTPLAPAAW